MAAVNALCSRCIFLKNGRYEFDGATSTATVRYYEEALPTANANGDLLDRPRREGNGKGRFRSVTVQPFDGSGGRVGLAYPGCDIKIGFELDCLQDFSECNLAVILWDMNGYRVIDTNIAQKGEFLSLRCGQKARAEFVLRELLLKPGTYFISLWVGKWPTEVIDHVEQAATLEVLGNEETSRHSTVFPGVYLCRSEQTVAVVEPVEPEVSRS